MVTITSGQTVVVAEDEKFLAGLVKKSLEEVGLSVQVAHDGVTALRMVKHLNPDLVILDVNMPGRSGLDVLGAIKDDVGLQHTPVVMLTAARSEGEVMEAIRLGATDYVTKPFPPALLVRRVLNQLG